MAFDTGREGGSPELHLLLFDGLTFYNWETHITEPVIAPVRRALKPVQIGSVGVDLAFVAVFVAVILLRALVVPLIPF